jgi:hypothetical protein
MRLIADRKASEGSAATDFFIGLSSNAEALLSQGYQSSADSQRVASRQPYSAAAVA